MLSLRNNVLNGFMLDKLEQNIAKLVASYEEQKHRADELEDKLRLSEEQALKYKEQITELNLKIENMKLMSAIAGSGQDAKETVNKLIREIDRCISLLES